MKLGMSTTNKLLLLIGGGSTETPITYLFRDEFTTDEAAPIATPHAALPGPGAVTVVQTDGQFSTADGWLVVPAQTTPAWTDLGFYSNTGIPRAVGLGLFGLHNLSTLGFIFSLGAATVGYNPAACWFSRSAYGYEIYDGDKLIRAGGDTVLATDLVFGIILRATGAYYLQNEALIAVGYNSTTATLYPRLTNGDSVYTLDYLRAAQLPAPFADDTLRVYSDATPTDGDAATAGQDALHTIEWTPVESEVFELRFRWVDDDNCMILRCAQAGTMKLIKRLAGAETEINSANVTFTAGTKRRLYLRYTGSVIYSGVVDVNIGAQSTAIAYNSEVTGSKIAGATTLANWEIFPSILPNAVMDTYYRYIDPFAAGSGRTPQTISVANGGDINAAVATMQSGDTLSLAPGGSYTFASNVDGFTALPSGFWGQKTRVLGNGATITGGKQQIYLVGKRHIHIENLTLADAVERSLIFSSCRWFTLDNISAASNAGLVLWDVFRFVACRNGEVTNCEAGPSTGWGAHDGFECTNQSGDITFTNCEAHGVIHGFEVWTGAAQNWKCYNITWRNCSSHDNTVGYSAEGGEQSLAHVEIVADSCTAATNSEFDYQGIDGATLYIEHGTGGTTNGSVTVRS